MAIGSQIKRYRGQLGWTLEKLSEASGVDVGTISALEIRNSSRSQFFISIAKAFGLTLEQLADESKTYTLDVKPTPDAPIAAKPATAPITLVTSQTNQRRSNWENPDWPFLNVNQAQFDLLLYEEKMHIESDILLRIKGREPPLKQNQPATDGTAA